MIAVGRAVRMSAKGKKEYTDGRWNPHDELGVVERVQKDDGHTYIVLWPRKNVKNCYRKDEIELVCPDE